ncbi:MAG TPA: hypothetical protein DDY37_00840 [Legionella sp.]|nr:hypothetical protein [Legionella sp.]
MKRHAYLIAAHDNYCCLRAAIKLIDDNRNDIFLHIDADSRDFEPLEFLSLVRFSRIYLIERTSVKWGHHSQIKVTLDLLSTATEKQSYEYYHFMQGADLPIKTQDIIHDFFEKNNGLEFIDIKDRAHDFAEYKANHFHLFTGFKGYRNSKLLRYANHLFAKLQSSFRIKRNNDNYYLGSALFSITNNTARLILKSRERILRQYRMTLACDEVFMQTEIMKLIQEKNINIDTSKSNLRLIDWRHGVGNSPKTFTIEDYDFLMNLSNDYLFARKFDERVDLSVIHKIQKCLTK